MAEIKNLVLLLLRPDGNRSAYFNEPAPDGVPAPLQHKMRVKSKIFGWTCGTYSEGMNFDLCLSKGYVIEVDNRGSYIKRTRKPKREKRESNKKPKRCALCGQTT
jgi:hypothetical protein